MFNIFGGRPCKSGNGHVLVYSTFSEPDNATIVLRKMLKIKELTSLTFYFLKISPGFEEWCKGSNGWMTGVDGSCSSVAL